MSYTTITQSTQDYALQARVMACVSQQAWVGGAQFKDSAFGELARADAGSAMLQMIWPVAIDYAAEYESAVISDNPNPGGDPAVITDSNIEAAVQVHWPADAVP